MRFLDWIDLGIRGIGVVTAWLTVVSIAAYGALQMLDRKLHLGVSSYLPDLSTSLLFILIFLTFGYTYLRDGHVRVDVLRRHWSARRIAWIELIGGLFVLLPLAAILTYYGWDGLMRTTKYAETQLWAQRIAGVIGPILLALAGMIVALRNIAFLTGRRAQGAPEFCRSWLGRSEGYIRVLRYHNTEPSVETLSICASKLGYYEARLAGSERQEHQIWAKRLSDLKTLCDRAIAKQAEAVWRAPERMAV